MTDFITELGKVFTKLLKLQQADPPVFILEGITNVLRFALLGAAILAGVLLVQMLVCMVRKKNRSALWMGITALVMIGISVWGFGVSVPVAAKEEVMSISVQTLAKDAEGKDIYGNTTPLSDAQMAEMVAMVSGATSARTLARTLPPPSADSINLVFTLEGDKSYQILLTPEKGYRYLTATTDFIYSIKDYDRFYAAIKTILG